METSDSLVKGRALPMELGGESLLTRLGIVAEKIDPSSSEPEAHKRDTDPRKVANFQADRRIR